MNQDSRASSTHRSNSAPVSSPSFIRKHPNWVKLFSAMLAVGIFLLAAELAFRGARYIVKGPDSARAETVRDPELGWRLNTARELVTKRNKCGEQVVLARDEHPYLVKTPARENPTRVLFLGDSFTQAHEVSSGHAYYHTFEEVTRDWTSVYAAGVGGFGSLQEYLLLKKVYGEVRPHIVIWQLHRNDVSNNVFALDNASFYNNQRPRPYLNLDTGETYVDDPGFFLFENSALFRFLFHKALALDWRFDLGLLDAANSLVAPSENEVVQLQRKGLEVLRIVLERAVAEYPETRFFGFSTDEPFDEAFQAVFEEAGAGYFPLFHRSLDEHPETTDCRPLDDHWNHRGNEVAGTSLAESLRESLQNTDGTPPGEDLPARLRVN